MTTTSDQEPILASWKISEVLQRYPRLLDVLVELSPAFTKLRNPIMRRVQSRLVTVSQAADIAGIEPAALTRKLNQAAGITAPEPESAASSTIPDQQAESSPPAWVESAPVAAELDVRPLMARGEEPFRAIMQAARTVPIGSVLLLRVGFEPLPLYDELAKQGFTHSATPTGDDWEISFYRSHDTRSTSPSPPKPDATPAVDWEAPTGAEVTIDVSELVPPEPMVKILQTLEALPPDGRLLVHHVRRPIHLYDRLNEMGYAHDTREPEPGHVEVLIQKRATPAMPS